MGIWMGPRGKAKKKLPPKFTSTGVLGTDYLYAEQTDENGVVHFEIAVLNTCAFTFRRVVPVDLFIVGSGKNGARGSATWVNGVLDVKGGTGGDGAKRLTAKKVALVLGKQYDLSIGTGGEETTGFDRSSADGEEGKHGGHGARVYGPAYSGTENADDGKEGEYAFGESDSLLFPGRKYGASAGGGAAKNGGISKSAGMGKETGSGTGGTTSAQNGTAGAANTGSGGGGGYSVDETLNDGSPGGSGIMIIRDAR